MECNVIHENIWMACWQSAKFLPSRFNNTPTVHTQKINQKCAINSVELHWFIQFLKDGFVTLQCVFFFALSQRKKSSFFVTFFQNVRICERMMCDWMNVFFGVCFFRIFFVMNLVVFFQTPSSCPLKNIMPSLIKCLICWQAQALHFLQNLWRPSEFKQSVTVHEKSRKAEPFNVLWKRVMKLIFRNCLIFNF